MKSGRKAQVYRDQLVKLDRADWDAYLLSNSDLPGPRGNIELAQVAADLGTALQFERWLTWDVNRAPVNTAEEFLPFCGVVG